MRGFMRHLCAGVINICTLRYVEYNFFCFYFYFSVLFGFFLYAEREEKKLPAVCGILNILYVHYQQDNSNKNTLKRVVALEEDETFIVAHPQNWLLCLCFSDWTSAAITRTAMPRCSLTTRWPCPEINQHGWNCCHRDCIHPRSYWTLGCIWAVPPRRQLASLLNCRQLKVAPVSPAVFIPSALMDKRAKFSGKCSFVGKGEFGHPPPWGNYSWTARAGLTNSRRSYSDATRKCLCHTLLICLEARGKSDAPQSCR